MELKTWRIQGKDVPYESGTVPVSDCILDPKNPRIQYLLGTKAGVMSQEEIESALWDKDPVKALAQSIFHNGGVREPIIVQKDGGKYLAREGNCRVVSLRNLIEQYPNDSRFASVPAMIFDKELSAEDLAVILADMHVAGKIQWDPYEQAQLVKDLHKRYGKTYEWLSNHLRLSKSKIKELLATQEALDEYLKQHPDPSNLRKFSIFHEVMRKKELRQKFETDEGFKASFHRWVADQKITGAREIRKLPRILAEAPALKALDKEGYAAAEKVLITQDPSLGSDLFMAVKNATDALQRAPMEELKNLEANPQKLIMLRNLKRALQDLETLAKISL
ncbi:hypothetical protein L0156_12055 [bacterium]|nr:hypothetical protein [bacterium]